MKKIYNKYILLFIFWAIMNKIQAQSQNLIIVTIDGLRWQEVFNGIDSSIAKGINKNPSSFIYQFWDNNPLNSRKKIFPFMWSEIANKGQIWGNRNYNNKVQVANPYWISYPGYAEIFCGIIDKTLNSNNSVVNPNVNVLEYLNAFSAFRNKIAVFAVWKNFKNILNVSRSKLLINTGSDLYGGATPDAEQKLLNQLKLNSLFYANDTNYYQDQYVFYGALDYLKKKKPKILYIALTQTDYYGHQNNYNQYIMSAYQSDKWLKELWDFIQSDPQYKNKTTIFVAVDHGRGIGKDWTSHYYYIPRSNESWFAIIGPNIPANGEIKIKDSINQVNFAATFAKILGYSFALPNKTFAPPIDKIFLKKFATTDEKIRIQNNAIISK